jgi:hypothetical protein
MGAHDAVLALLDACPRTWHLIDTELVAEVPEAEAARLLNELEAAGCGCGSSKRQAARLS